MGTFRENVYYTLRTMSNKVRCPKCGTLNIFKYSQPKMICRYCESTVYNKNEIGKKSKFQDMVKKKMLEEKRKEINNETNNKETDNKEL